MVIVAAAVATLAGVGLWPSAEATPSRAEVLEAVLTAPAGAARKAMAIEELRNIDSSDARSRLAALADSRDDRLAVLAIRALGRADTTSGTSKLAGIYEDTNRSDLVRGVALAAWLDLASQHGRTWADGKVWVKRHAGSREFLRDQYEASKGRNWANEVDGE